MEDIEKDFGQFLLSMGETEADATGEDIVNFVASSPEINSNIYTIDPEEFPEAIFSLAMPIQGLETLNVQALKQPHSTLQTNPTTVLNDLPSLREFYAVNYPGMPMSVLSLP